MVQFHLLHRPVGFRKRENTPAESSAPYRNEHIMAGTNDVKRVDLTTGIGIASFPHLFVQTKDTNDKGEDVYDVQFIFPKSDRKTAKAILDAYKEVAEAKWGSNYKKARNPLRSGDKEQDEITEKGERKGDKYPERLGCYFFTARSKRPIAVVDRSKNLITDPAEVYGGCKVKIAITLYPYATNGNIGVGVGLSGVQKVADGEPLGATGPTIDSMFDLLDDEDDLDLEDEVDEEPEPEPEPVKPAAKKTAAKKTAAKKPEPEPDDEDDLLGDDDDEDDEFADLDDDV